MEFHLIPKYRSLDVVEALKIKEIRFVNLLGADVVKLIPADERFSEITLPNDFAIHNTLKPGGYWVRHAGVNSSSYVPAELIEGHYKLATEITPELLKNIRAVVAKDLVSDE